MEWMLMPLRRYAEFSGRSRRKEYWMYVLLLVIVALVIGLVEAALGLSETVGPYGPLSGILALVTFVPSIAVGVRRLHDTNRSGWWLLIGFAPYLLSMALVFSGNLVIGGVVSLVALIGMIALLIFLVLDGTKGPNKYGEDPKGGPSSEVFA